MKYCWSILNENRLAALKWFLV